MPQFLESDLTLDENKTPPTEDELLFTIRILDKLEGTKLVTEHEETAIAIVTNALVAISDPENLHLYKMDRVGLRVKVWYENESS